MTPSWLTAFVDLAPGDHDAGQAFWRAVTGYAVSPARGGHGEFATLLPSDGDGDGYLRTQRLGHGPSGHHLDLHVADPRAAADRAVGLGATEVDDQGDVVVLRSPAGLTFCAVPEEGQGTRRPAPATWPDGLRSQVDQVCLDLPPSSYDEECAFWAALTGFTPGAVSPGFPEFRRLDGPGALRLLLQRLDDDRAPGLHLDLAADDPAAEVERHLALGARFHAEGRGWTVLETPYGVAYCVTSRPPGTQGPRPGT